MKLVDIEGIILFSTKAAINFKYDPDKDPIWIPKSIAEIYEDSKTEYTTITIPENFAYEKGMI